MFTLHLPNYFDKFRVSSIITIFLGCVACCAFAADETDYTRLRKDLKLGYDPSARPVQHHSNNTRVQMALILRGFDFDEQKSVFTMYAWAIMNWNDYHLKWNPEQYGNITHMNFAAHEIWQPDIAVYNKGTNSEVDHFQNTRVIGFSSGSLSWVPPCTFKVGCTANLRKWPYDSQSCRVILGSWSHSGEDLDIVLPANYSKIDEPGWVPNREWDLVSNTVLRRVTYYACCPNVPYVDILFTMNLQRKSSTHVAAIVVPALAIAAAVLISFWIPTGASERLAVLLFVVVINSMYLYNVYAMLPSQGDEVPLIILYYRDSLVMVSMALLWTICLRYLAASKRTSPVPLPGFIQSFLDSWASKVLCLDPRPNAFTPSSNGGDGEASDAGKLLRDRNPYQADWAWLAYLLDRFAFAIYLIVYIIFALAFL